MRFLVYTVLLFFIPFAGFTQVRHNYANTDSLASLINDTSKISEKGGGAPPQIYVASPNDLCGGAIAITTSTVMSGPTNGFNASDGVANDPLGSCFWTGGVTGRSTWFTYTPANSGSLTVTCTGAAAIAGLEVAIFAGTCATLTTATTSTLTSQLACGSVATSATTGTSASASASCLIAGETYYILVGEANGNGNYTVTTSYVNNATTGPSNNCCSNAIDITASINNTPVTGGTTAGATPDSPYPSGCNKGFNNVWYSFVAQGPNVEITVNGGATLGPEFELLTASSGTATDVCTGSTVTSVTCNTATSATAIATNVGSAALIVGQTYYIAVTSTLTAGGAFTLTVNNPVPDPPGTNCATAALLCSTTPNVFSGGNTNLWGTEELNATTAGCNATNGELHSAWYVINVITSGSLTFTISPAVATDNYDFSVFNNTPATCSLTAPVSCNSSTLTTGSGKTGLDPSGVSASQGASGTLFNQQITATAGDVYLLMVNSPKPAGTYSITLGTNGTPTAATYTDCSTFPVILPIGLMNFTATQTGSEVDLIWNTASEINNSYFTVERGEDGKNFEVLSKVKSEAESGNSTKVLHYNDVDYVPLAGVSYYRLSQTDINGKTTKLVIVSVINKDNDGAFTVAPNPTDGMLNITYACQTATTGVLKLYDNNGALVIEENVTCALGTNKTHIDLLDKPNGIYFATFTTNTSFYRSKLIKK